MKLVLRLLLVVVICGCSRNIPDGALWWQDAHKFVGQVRVVCGPSMPMLPKVDWAVDLGNNYPDANRVTIAANFSDRVKSPATMYANSNVCARGLIEHYGDALIIRISSPTEIWKY